MQYFTLNIPTPCKVQIHQNEPVIQGNKAMTGYEEGIMTFH